MRPHLALAATFCAAIFLVALGRVPLVAPDEAREAEVAREAWAAGPFAAPRLNGKLEVEASPLATWTTAAAFAVEARLAGGAGARPEAATASAASASASPSASPSASTSASTSTSTSPARAYRRPPDWAARIGPALFALAMCLTTFLLGKGWFSTRHGALAALVLATSPEAFSAGRHLTAEPALACGITIAAGAALTTLRAMAGRRFASFLACSGAGFAIAYLASGAVGVALALFAISAAILTERGLRGFFTLRALAILGAAALFLAPAVGLRLFILAHEGGRDAISAALSSDLATVRIGGFGAKPWYFYLLEGAAGFAPWVAFLPLAGVGRAHGVAPGGHPEFRLRLLVAWAIGPIVLLSLFAQKRALFVLPAYPPLALLVASAILEPAREGRAALAARVLWALVFLAAAAGGVAAPIALAAREAILARAAGADPGTLAGIAVAGGLLALAAVAAIAAARRDATEREAPLAYPFMTASLGAVLALSGLLFVEPRLPRRAGRTLEPLGRAVADAVAAEPGVRLLGCGLAPEVEGAVAFELGRTFAIVDAAGAKAALERDPAARVLFGVERWLEAGRPGRELRDLADPRDPLVLVAPGK